MECLPLPHGVPIPLRQSFREFSRFSLCKCFCSAYRFLAFPPWEVGARFLPFFSTGFFLAGFLSRLLLLPPLAARYVPFLATRFFFAFPGTAVAAAPATAAGLAARTTVVAAVATTTIVAIAVTIAVAIATAVRLIVCVLLVLNLHSCFCFSVSAHRAAFLLSGCRF